MAKPKNIDDVYPVPAKSDSTWWVFRTSIQDSGTNTTLVAYTPLSVQEHYSKDKAQKYMEDSTKPVKPSEVKLLLGPVSRTEAFNWCTLNPYLIEGQAQQQQEQQPQGGGSPDPKLSQAENDRRTNAGQVYMGDGTWAT